MIRPLQRSRLRSLGFTLIELSLSLGAGAVILVAIYGVFSRAIHMRDNATERTRAMRVESHVVDIIRRDLRGARVSGGSLAATLTGSQRSQNSSFPGYLKFLSTTARDTGDVDLATTDLQQVEYYITTDPNAKDSRSGMLVRAVDTNLLAPVRELAPEEPLLTGIESMEVTFFDGNSWQDTWDYETDTTLPEAVRVRLQPAGENPRDPKPPVIEILVPWTTQTATATATTSTDGSQQ